MDLLTGICTFVLVVIIGNYFHYRNLANAKKVSFKFAFLPILAITTSPLLLLSIPFFTTCRQIVDLILFWKYRSKYWGLLEGPDAFFNLEKHNPVYNLFIVKYPSNFSQNFYDAVKDNIYKVLEQKAKTNVKIFGAIRTYMGYSYILKNKITFDDCFKELKLTNSPISKDDLMQLIDEYTYIPLPKNGQAMWEVFVGTQPVQWTSDIENNNVKYYPILFRKNHVLADAEHFFNGIVELFADNKKVKVKCAPHISQNEDSELGRQKLLSPKIILNFVINTGMVLKYYMRQFGILLLFPSALLVYSLLMVNSKHILHGSKPTSRRFLFLNAEESPRYIEVVKRIKKKISGCTFEDVCLTAIAASFAEYLQKNSPYYIPDYIIAEMPVIPPKRIGREKPKIGELFCRNRITFSLRTLPVNIDLENPCTLINMLQSIGKEGTLMRLSFEHEINYFFFTLACHIAPSQIIRFYLDTFHNTAVVSNVRGPYAITVMGGCEVQDMSAWTTTRGHTGICFTIFTYDDRLQLSMVVDKALTSNRNDVQSLIDGVYKYLDILEHEALRNTPDNYVRQLKTPD